jgi:hypothetical protein
MQSVPKDVSLNPTHREAYSYSMQHYVIKFISDLQQVDGFLRVLWLTPPLKVTTTINRPRSLTNTSIHSKLQTHFKNLTFTTYIKLFLKLFKVLPFLHSNVKHTFQVSNIKWEQVHFNEMMMTSSIMSISHTLNCTLVINNEHKSYPELHSGISHTLNCTLFIYYT